MDSFYFEEKLNEYYSQTSLEKSSRNQLFKLAEFYNELLTSNNELFINVYFAETSVRLLVLLENFSVYGIEPNKSVELIEILKQLCEKLNDDELKSKILRYAEKIEGDLEKLKLILEGNETNLGIGKISFPVLEKTGDFISENGLLEEIDVSINKNKKSRQTIFNIVPSPPKIEEKLDAQIHKSWDYAVNYIKSKYKKYNPNLEVTIRFVNKLGLYEGNSLGIVLTVEFIKELIGFYELREKINFESNIVATGALNENGDVEEVGKEIIQTKVIISFYSLAEILIVAQNDYQFAKESLTKLNTLFPKRSLELLPVINVKDVITRRDTLNIKKQNIISWGGRKVLKNKVPLALLILLIGVIFGFYYINQDDNPHHFEYKSNKILIANKYGKILWEYDNEMNAVAYAPHFLAVRQKIDDIDNDGINEVILSDSKSTNASAFDYKKNILWNYKFNYDGLRTATDKFENNYYTGVVDIDDKNVVFRFSHSPYYPSGLVKVNKLSGKQEGSILWNAGRISFGMIEDNNEDGKMEIIVTGTHNGFGRVILFSINLDELNGQSPSIDNYTFENIPTANFNEYILLPKIDFFRYFFQKYNVPYNFIKNDKNIYVLDVSLREVHKITGNHVAFNFNENFDLTDIVFSDEFIQERDKFVKEGKLNYPLTETKEYRQSLIDQLEYWDGEKFVKHSQK